MLSDAEPRRYPIAYGADALNIRGRAVVIVGDIDGMGRTAAAMMAENGAPVFIAARDHTELKTALAAIAQAGGEGDGIVVDLSKADEVQRFFEQAKFWLGKIDAVVSYLIGDSSLKAEVCQNLVMQEAIQHLQGNNGQIINVGTVSGQTVPPHTYNTGSVRNTAAALRRQATDLGIRVTLIQPGSMPICQSPDEEEYQYCAEEVARCVVNSLAQPYGIDIVFLKLKYPEPVEQV